MKKFELTPTFIEVAGMKMYQIKALKSFGNVREGELGGFIEKEGNLSQSGAAWVYGAARVYGAAQVSGDARVSGAAQVSGDARVEKAKDYLCIGPVGDDRFITATKSDKMVVAGCFRGSVEKFTAAVDEKYNGRADYYFIIPVLKAYFEF